MKKIFLSLIAIFLIQVSCFAATGITFVYINGSNNNDAKMKHWYENGVKKLHPCMKAAFEQNSLSNKYFLKNGQLVINPEPGIFFWGDKSRNDLMFVEKNLAMSKGFSPWLAFQIRSMLAKFLHDAIWVQKYHNMLPIVDDLHQMVVSEAKKGNKVVLLGYSAGSFVTYEYLLTRMPYISPSDFFNKVDVGEMEREFVAKHPMKNTCMNALGQELAVFSAAGHIVPNRNYELFKKNYLQLDEMTAEFCANPSEIKGIINFASPLVLFYSDLSDPNYEITYYNRLLFEYLIENDMFWLTVNYREDPLGFPGGRNLSIEEVERLTNLDIDPHLGFMYDQSDTKGTASAFSAHTSYWSTRKVFSRAVANAYVKGYLHNYDDSKKSELMNKRKIPFHYVP